MTNLSALVVDDDATYRRILEQSLRRVGATEVGMAGEIGVARRKLASEAFDVVTIDVVMRGESGLDLLKWVVANHPEVTPILVTSGAASEACRAVDGLLLGAQGLILKPSGPGASAELDAALASAVAVRRARAGTARGTGRIAKPTTMPPPARPLSGPALAPILGPARREVIAVGASTGGPVAVLELLLALPQRLRTPILITQHMPGPHVPHFAALLRERTGREVSVAEDGQAVAPGRVYLAPGGAHLRLVRHGEALQLVHDHGPEEHHCKPAVDPMFRSVAEACGGATVGVVLTGMGSDGALGAVALRHRGAPVLVQDRASSVVWGMPGAVVAKQAADVVAPVAELATWVEKLDGVDHSTWRKS